MLSSRSQSQKTTYGMIPTEMSRIGRSIETGSQQLPRPQKKEQEVTASKYGVSFGHDENILKSKNDDGCTTL